MKMKNYKIVFIDWNDTLSKSKFWGHLEDSTEKDKEMFTKIEDALFCQLRHLIKPWMRGEVNSEDIINEISARTGYPYKDVFDEFIKGCQTMNYVSEEVLPLIQNLKHKGVKVIIATDNMDSFHRWTVPALKLNEIFDGILDSYTLRALKNDFNEMNKSLFFDDFFKDSGFRPGESVLIDDSEDKDGKIQSYGIDYFRISPEKGLIFALRTIRDSFGAD